MRNFISDILLRSGDMVRSHFGVSEVHHKSGAENTVTEADLLSQKMIRAAVKDRFPDHAFLGEESREFPDVNSKSLWVVDPLDGTNNFSCGMPHFSISVAYAEDGRVQCGGVYDPVRRELFVAQRGKGAFLNGAPITVSRRKSLGESLICTGFYYDRGAMMRRTLKAMERVFENGVRGIRRTGSAALDLSWVAAGRFDGFFEYELHPWDYAAGILLVEEAGGSVTDIDGSPVSLNSMGIVSGSKRIFNEFYNLVKWT
ncbi:MAG: inositol monophosphatase family protein [Fibrobacterota bacterium]